MVAMVGKDCVAIASDLRLGNQALTVACNFEKVSSIVRSFAGVLEQEVGKGGGSMSDSISLSDSTQDTRMVGDQAWKTC